MSRNERALLPTDVLFAAAEKAGSEAYLALLTYHELGQGDDGNDYWSRGRRHWNYDDDDEGDGDYTMVEVYETELSADAFRTPEDLPGGLREMVVSESELVMSGSLTDVEPEEHFEGFTGNAGMELDRWYRHAAIILWPGTRHFDILCNEGTDAAAAGLGRMVSQWKKARGEVKKSLKPKCLEFAKRIISNWSPREFGRYAINRADEETERQGMLAALVALGDEPLAHRFLKDAYVEDASLDISKSVVSACRKFGWLAFRDELLHAMNSTHNQTITRNAGLLETLCTTKTNDADRLALCSEMAGELLAAMKRWDATKTTAHAWQLVKVDRVELVSMLFRSCWSVGADAHLLALIEHITHNKQSKKYDLTTTLVPAAQGLNVWVSKAAKSATKESSKLLAAYVALLEACRESLELRIMNPPKPPANWRRPSKLSCDCGDCIDLSTFLDSPGMHTHRFSVRKDRRQHLHRIIDQHKCDLTHVTERKGSPQTLVCTKTLATHERKVAAHQVDHQQLEQITELCGRFK